MKKSKLLPSSLLVVFVIALGSVLLTSSTTVEQSNSKALAELSAELADMKEELTNLKITEENMAVSAEPFLGKVILFAGNFAPRGWAFCEGQLLAISQYPALFSILGNTYGGDGGTSFALPDLRGRNPIGVGGGPGLSTIKWGQRSGSEYMILNSDGLPNHDHLVSTEVQGFEFDSAAGANQFIKGNKSFVTVGNTPNTKVNNFKGNTSKVGENQSFTIRDPYLGMRYIIAIDGLFPSRN